VNGELATPNGWTLQDDLTSQLDQDCMQPTNFALPTMTSPEKRRQIENWALTVAACANGIDELRVNEAPVTSGTERSGTTATSYGTSIQHGTIKPLRDSHVVRVVVQESSSEGSTRSRDRSREVRSSRPVVVSNISRPTSRSRPAYTGS